MPYLNNSTIATKARGVLASQDVLYLMHKEPWCVNHVTIDHDRHIMVAFDDGPTMFCGNLSPEYQDDPRTLHIQSWKVTGGEAREVVNGFTKLQYFGLNLRILIRPAQVTPLVIPERVTAL